MKILYVANMSRGSTGEHRFRALVRLGHELSVIDLADYTKCGLYPLPQIRHRTLWGLVVRTLNRDLIRQAYSNRPDLIWLDKATYVWPETIQAIRKIIPITPIVSYIVDNPWSGRDWGWRHYLAGIPQYDAHVISHQSRIEPLQKAGARKIIYMSLGYEPSVHFPPPLGQEQGKTTIVSFIGYPWDNRPQIINSLYHNWNIRVQVFGNKWRGLVPRDIIKGPGLYNDDYRDQVWGSDICLGFVNHANSDAYARRTFEIMAMGGCLLTERTGWHRTLFTEGKDIEFFSHIKECAEAIRSLMANPDRRKSIGATAANLQTNSPYSNDELMSKCLDEVYDRSAAS